MSEQQPSLRGRGAQTGVVRAAASRGEVASLPRTVEAGSRASTAPSIGAQVRTACAERSEHGHPALDLSWVYPYLAVGGSLPRGAAELLRRQAILHVVDARDDVANDLIDLRAHGVEVLHVPTPDHRPLDPARLQHAVRWVVEHIDLGERVLIHCEHGVGRSVLLALAVLVELELAPADAMRRIKFARPEICPSPAQLDAFVAFCAEKGIADCRWDQLARLAYSAAPYLPKLKAERVSERSGLRHGAPSRIAP
jgi:hypothetical protein